jgi:hypothetical protein
MYMPSTANNFCCHVKYILTVVKGCFHVYKVQYVLILINGFMM